MIGTLNMLTNYDKVLFDTGASVSCIAQTFIDAHGVRCSTLESLIVIVKAGGRLLVSQIRLKQAIIIRECKFEADLIVMPLKGLAVILGMDWMTSHGAHIDCERHTVSIRRPDRGRIVYQGDQRNQ